MDLNLEFESLMEEQFQLDLISDTQVDQQELFDELIGRRYQDLNMGIYDCLNSMNKRR